MTEDDLVARTQAFIHTHVLPVEDEHDGDIDVALHRDAKRARWLSKVGSAERRLPPGSRAAISSRTKSKAAAARATSCFTRILPCAYTIDELSSTVTVLVLDVGTARFRVADPAHHRLPGRGRHTGRRDHHRRVQRLPVRIQPKWRRRSHPRWARQDSIAIFRVDPITGLLDTVGFQRCGGIHPRLIALNDSGSLLFCASSHTITELAVAGDGTLSTARVVASTGSPVCTGFR